jgi:hypothetical protein
MACSVEEPVEENAFLRSVRRNRPTIGADRCLASSAVAEGRLRTRRGLHGGRRFAGGERWRIEGAFAAASSQSERGSKRADDGKAGQGLAMRHEGHS